MAQGILINDFRPVYSENVLSLFSDFESTSIINKTSGSATSGAIFTSLKNYDGTQCIMSYNDDILTPLVFNFGSNLSKTITKTGTYIFSLELLHISAPVFNDVLKVNIYVDGLLTGSIENGLVNNDTGIGIDKDKWHCFAQSFIFSEGQVIDFTFEHTCAATGFGFSTIYFDALKLEYDDRNLGTPSIYSRPLIGVDTIPSSFVFVSSLADLPTAVAGVITLEDNYTYYITSTIDLGGNRLVGGSNTTIIGSSSENSILTSTGLGVGIPLLSSIYTTPIRHICIKDVDTAIDFDGTTNPNDMALDFTGVNFVNVPNIGIVKDASNFIFDKGAFVNSKGLSFDGTIGTVGFGNCLFSGDGLAGNLLELLSTCVITRRFRVIYSSIVAFGSTTGINVNVSATVPIESYILDTINFSGGGSYLGGVMVNDNKTNFLNCKGIQNSAEISQYFMHANATTTVVASTGVAYKALGTTTSSAITQKFTNTNNKATYVGSITRNFLITASLSVESGNNNQIGVYIAKNGSISTDSEVYGTTSGTGRGENIVAQTLVELSENDYIEIFVENESSTANILVTDLNVIIK